MNDAAPPGKEAAMNALIRLLKSKDESMVLMAALSILEYHSQARAARLAEFRESVAQIRLEVEKRRGRL